MVSRTRASDATLGRSARQRPEAVALAELDAYRAIPRPTEWIPHASFGSPGVERELFGTDDLPPSLLPWTYIPESGEEGEARPRQEVQLKPAEEKRRFLQYNYARFRLAQLLAAEDADNSVAVVRAALLWHERSVRLRSLLIRANMPLVPTMVRKFLPSDMEFCDLASEGNIALIHCVEKFDISRGFRFSTYACRAILKRLGRLTKRATCYRLRFPATFDPNLERSRWDARTGDPQRQASLADLRDILHENRAELDRMERTIVSERFALSAGGARKTLREMGDRLGLSPERIRQIQQKALLKLRAALTGEPVA